MHAPQISVVIPTYQRRESVRRLLKAFEQQTMKADLFEVLIVIDGSSDGTDDLVTNTKTAYPLRAMSQPRRGRAATCNTGIRSAQGDLIVLLDDDMEPTPGFLAGHWQAHQGQERLGVVGAAPVVVRTGSSGASHYIAEKFRQHLEKLSQPGYRLTLRDFYSGNFSIRREYLLEAGLFDEEFRIYGNEDLELSLRLRKAGISLVYCGDALADQYYEKDFPSLARDNIEKGKTAVLLTKKHPEASAELRLSTAHHDSWRWRFLRAGLLRVSSVWSKTPDAVIQIAATLERIPPVQRHLFYPFMLDYFYWLGVQDVQ